MRRIPDNWSWTGMSGGASQAPCPSDSHEPPAHVVLEPGTYEHECPQCGNWRIVVITPRPM